MTVFRVDADSNVSSLEDKRKKRAGFEKPAVLETPNVDLNAEVDSLARELGAMRSRLEFLRGAVEVHSLSGALIGFMGNNAEEMRIQLRPLRKALKDDGGDAA